MNILGRFCQRMTLKSTIQKQLVVFRKFSSQQSKDLSLVLENEIKGEQLDESQSRFLSAFLTEHKWKIITSEENTKVVLSKDVGNKQIKIYYQAKIKPNQSYGETENTETEDQETSSENYFEFFILISGKNEKKILIDAVAIDQQISISGILCSENAEEIAESKDTNPYNYTGPAFDTLDTELMEKTNEYISQLGINADLCQFMEESSVNHESVLYRKFLLNLKEFVSN